MISKIKLKFGSTPKSGSGLEVTTTPVTIFVGPNNSGKSKILQEIERYCLDGNNIGNMILEEISFTLLTNPDLELKKYSLPKRDLSMPDNEIFFGNWKKSVRIKKEDLLNILNNPSSRKSEFANFYVSLNTLRLDGSNRIHLINAQSGGDLQNPPENTLSVLIRDDAKRLDVRRILKDAFNKYFVIDPTNLGTLRIRLSENPPISITEEIGISKESIEFHRKALDITLASDGVKAFTGIITTIIAGDPNVILIDEPEAFLHPSLSRNLGKEVSNAVKGSQKNLFVSSHSANFLMGCIQSGLPINIIRLTYSEGVPTARLLHNEKVLKLMRNPLLRSTGILNGLFYEYVVVTEADSDRAFYEEINERLLAEGRGIANCLFLNARNKQTIYEIIKPLREMGIPCAAIVDIDIVKEGGVVWSNFLAASNMPSATIASTAVARPLIKNALDATGIAYKTNGGINVLSTTEKNSANDLFDQLQMYGLFVVRNGELESWLTSLGALGHSPKWLIEIFEKLGEDPTSENYIKPGKDDVWNFIENIGGWLSDTARKGNPE